MSRLCIQDRITFQASCKVEAKPIRYMTVQKFLQICRVMYDATNRYGEIPKSLSDEEVYCDYKSIDSSQTAWNLCGLDIYSEVDMAKLIDRNYGGYHFEEIAFGNWNIRLDWADENNHAAGCYFVFMPQVVHMLPEWMEKTILAINACIEAGYYIVIENKDMLLDYVNKRILQEVPNIPKAGEPQYEVGDQIEYVQFCDNGDYIKIDTIDKKCDAGFWDCRKQPIYSLATTRRNIPEEIIIRKLDDV